LKAFFTSRWREVVAATVVVAVFVSVGAVAVVQLGLQTTVDCSTLEAATFDKAGALARACNAEVEVLAARTPWDTSWATADEQTRLEVSTMPVRVDADGEWTDLDTTLVAQPSEGVVDVAAPVFPMTLNAGGAAGRGEPLGSIEREGKELQVWFPLDLPVPTLDESKATYDLGDGVTLVVSVNSDGTGFLPVVKLDNSAAMAHLNELLEAARDKNGGVSHGLDLEFLTAFSDGLSLREDGEDEGGVHIVDAAGETQFLATPPVMWDSSGTSIAVSATATEVGVIDRTRAPDAGDRISTMDISVDGDTVVVSPDAEMLASADTVWPIYIDPGFNAKTSNEWVAVRSGGYTGTLYKWTDISSSQLGQGTGYCSQASSCNVVFKQRLAWEFSGLTDIAALDGVDISDARMKVYGSHSYNCTSQKASLYRTSALSTGTTWSNLSWYSTVLGSRTEYHSVNCGNTGYKEYVATSALKYTADNDKSSVALGLKVDESSMSTWKRFRANATLSVTYNRHPDTPTAVQMTLPLVSECVSGEERPVISSTTPTLSAFLADPDGGNVQASFAIVNASDAAILDTGGTVVPVWESGNLAAVKSGNSTSTIVPAAKLVNGGVYSWRANAYDGQDYADAPSEWCEFGVDTAAPAAPTVAPATEGAQAVYVEGAERGGVGQAGYFTISAGSESDATLFKYGFNDQALMESVEPDANGFAVISYTPTSTLPVTLRVKSVDAAGNASLTKTYIFKVAAAKEDAIWTLDEGTGTTSADSSGKTPARSLTLSGATWGDGPHSLFDSRQGDHDLVMNGVSDFASTDGPVVNTAGSFVVSAHVLADADKVGQGQSFTALSQDGVSESGFRLGYEATCPDMPDGCWAFTMPDSIDGAGETTVRSPVPVTGGEWTYLVAEQDAAQSTLRLWVCEIGTPTNPAVGEPVRTDQSRTATPWAASGSFTIGRSVSAGAPGQWWPGQVDNVRLFSGSVLDEAKIRRLCQGAEATDFNGALTPLDPTVKDIP
jgi:hypothetical protein